MILRLIGRVFIAAGLVILLFLAYELWGTSFVAQRNQQALADDLNLPETPAPSPAAEPPPPMKAPPAGTPVARIEIPKIDADWIVVEGTSVEALKKGPGHFTGTAYPGEKGNVVISAHRATYGAPFARMHEVGVGDVVRVSTERGVFEYRVDEKKIVAPTELAVVQDFNDERLTLTTCEPRYSSRLRMIVVAKPIAPQVPPA
jgi:sortase A